MTLSVLTPTETLFTGEITSVSVPAVPGILTILPHHAPITSLLSHGELRIQQDSKETIFSIGEGFISVSDDQVSVLVSRGANVQDLDEQIITTAKDQAEELLKNPPSEGDIAATQALYRQSIVDLKLLRKRKNRS